MSENLETRIRTFFRFETRDERREIREFKYLMLNAQFAVLNI